MYLETQYSIFMVNKPGMLSRILTAMAAAKINVVAMTMMDSMEHGVMRLVGSESNKIRQVLNGLNCQFNETDVLCLNLSNKAGALADVVEKLSTAHINISYAYCTAGARGGRTTGILKVADIKKAMKVLEGHAEVSKVPTNVRQSISRRK